jgi:hypothetical protein
MKNPSFLGKVSETTLFLNFSFDKLLQRLKDLVQGKPLIRDNL